MPVALSTVLYVEDVPVGYEVSRQGDFILFTPTRFTEKSCCPPQFSVMKQGNEYRFSEAITEDMKGQAVQALNQLQAGKLLE
ncbi:MAG TPA: hypothetical protein VD794_02985 [Flavisolibacter sp.]|nr:hypothetical protein [Flavisolibacter sp.]